MGKWWNDDMSNHEEIKAVLKDLFDKAKEQGDSYIKTHWKNTDDTVDMRIGAGYWEDFNEFYCWIYGDVLRDYWSKDVSEDEILKWIESWRVESLED